MISQPLYTTKQIRILEQCVMKHQGLSEQALMQRAACAALGHIQARYPRVRQCGLHIFCGTGKNAGDGYLLATLAQQSGIPTQVHALSPPNQLHGEAALAFAACKSANVPIVDTLEAITPDAILVDAILGTGLNRALSGDYLQGIEWINAFPHTVVALDIPSGLHADTGTPLPTAIIADATITFIRIKQGLLTGAGTTHSGQVILCDLGITDTPEDQQQTTSILQGDTLLSQLPPRIRHAHKGNQGHLLVVGGDIGMGGAAIMASEAALHTGCGSLTLATQPTHVPAAIARRPEIMAHSVQQAEDLTPLLMGKHAIVLGPGLGRSPWSYTMFQCIWHSPLPLLVDADGLYFMATCKLAPRSHPLVITPHSGEAARLLHCDSQTIESDRFTAVEKLQQRYLATVVLKGAGSLITSAPNSIRLCQAGNPGMAVGGMGDILSGIIGALLLSLEMDHAAQLGVWLHAKAGDHCMQQQGEHGMLATDILPNVRRLINGKIYSA